MHTLHSRCDIIKISYLPACGPDACLGLFDLLFQSAQANSGSPPELVVHSLLDFPYLRKEHLKFIEVKHHCI